VFRACIGKLRAAGETETLRPVIPVPERLTYCVPPELWIVSDPVRRPAAVGEKYTLKVQRVLPGFRTDPTHPPSVWKSPVGVLLLIVMAVLPGWRNVTLWAGLCEPTNCGAKLRTPGSRVGAGPGV
jgi:hypothetical protein